MTEGEVRDLCSRFFDAYENRRIDELAEIMAPDCIIWHNCFGREVSVQDLLAKMPDSYAMHRRRTYNDRTINAFGDGFVIQYTLHGVCHDGYSGSLWICIVGRCADGRITRIDEYIDSGKFPAFRTTPPEDRE